MDYINRLKLQLPHITAPPENQKVKLVNLETGYYVSKGKCIKLENEKAKAEQALSDAMNLIEQLKAEAPPDKAEYQRRVSDLEQQIKQVKIDTAVKVAFIDAGVADTDYINYKLHESGELELDDSGNVKGLSALIDRLKTTNPDSFTGAAGIGYYEGFRPTGELTEMRHSYKELIRMPYAEQVKFFNENPDEYREIVRTGNN